VTWPAWPQLWPVLGPPRRPDPQPPAPILTVFQVWTMPATTNTVLTPSGDGPFSH
jgi:hypothetical protein